MWTKLNVRGQRFQCIAIYRRAWWAAVERRRRRSVPRWHSDAALRRTCVDRGRPRHSVAVTARRRRQRRDATCRRSTLNTAAPSSLRSLTTHCWQHCSRSMLAGSLGVGQQSGRFLRVDNFATLSGRKACDDYQGEYPYWISSGLTVRAKYRALVVIFTVVWVTIGKILRCCQIQHNVKCTEHWCKQRKEYLISLTSKFYSLLNTIWKVLTYDTLTYQ